MFTVVVYHKQTRKIVAALPFEFDTNVRIALHDALLHNDFGFRVYSDTDPVLFEDYVGDICLKENSFFINGRDLTN